MEIRDPWIPVLQASDKVGESVKRMIENRAYHVIVVRGNELTGIISLRDLAMRIFLVVEEGIDVLEFGNLLELLDRRNSEVMTPNPITATSDEEALRLMMNKRVGAVPIVMERTLLGVISERSILPSLFDSPSALTKVSKPMITASEDSTVEEVMEIMSERNIRRVPLVNEEGKVTKIITLFQMISWIMNRLSRNSYDATILYDPVFPISIDPIIRNSLTLGEASRLLYDNPGLGAIIVDDGIVTERDMISYAYERLYKGESNG